MIPEEPRSRRRGDQERRNGEIFYLWFKGLFYEEIGEVHGLSGSRIGQLIGEEMQYCRLKKIFTEQFSLPTERTTR
jgi:hypothetical protein